MIMFKFKHIKIKKEIENIALNSFPYDRRFHIFVNYEDEMVESFIIKKWINDLDEVFVAKFKNKIIGFLALKNTVSSCWRKIYINRGGIVFV